MQRSKGKKERQTNNIMTDQTVITSLSLYSVKTTRAFMSSTTALEAELLTTSGTGERLLSGVNNCVVFQVPILSEAFLTDYTHVRLLSGVNAPVGFQ